MGNQIKKYFTLIVNPKSSKYNHQVICECMEVFRSNNCDVLLKEIPANLPKNAGFLPYMKKTILKSFIEGRIPISTGGDGTFAALQQAWVELSDEGILDALIADKIIDVPVVSHFGTGASNDMNINLDLPKKPTDAVQAIINGDIRQRDITLLNGTPFGYSAVLGLAADIPSSTPPELKRFLKVGGYVLHGISESFINRKQFWDPLINPYQLKLSRKGIKQFSKQGIILAIVNGKKFAGLEALPDDKMDDGMFNIIVVNDLLDLSAKFGECLLPGKSIADVIKTDFADIDIDNRSECQIGCDGEKPSISVADEFCVEMHEKRLSLLLPAPKGR